MKLNQKTNKIGGLININCIATHFLLPECWARPMEVNWARLMEVNWARPMAVKETNNIRCR